MPRMLQYPLQAMVYLAIAAVIGVFSLWPPVVHFPAEQAQIKLSLAHGAGRKEECHQRTAEELKQLAPNMRKQIDCPRERLPVWIEILVDGRSIYRASLPPTGLSGDGPSRIYARFNVAPGPRHLQLRLRDSARTEGFDYELDRIIDLKPQQNLAVDFRPELGGFILM
ncbi:MAG TPA: hypothetical protein VFZ07_03570 [Dongiaceae bacterium]